MPLAQDGPKSLHYALEGDGPPVVLLPGLGGGMRLFGTLPRRFARSGFAALTYDPAGIPPSSPLDGPFDFDQAARDVWTLIDAAGFDSVRLVGTSLGGKVALTAAAQRPDRVERMVLLASSCHTSPRAARVYRFFEAVAEHLPAERFADAVAPFLFGKTFHTERNKVVDDIVRATRPPAETRTLMVAQARALARFDAREAAGSLALDVLCIAGAEDTLTLVDEVRSTADLLPRGRYVERPTAGHSILLEDAGAFDVVIGFLAESR